MERVVTTLTPILRLTSLPPYCLVVGDPNRAAKASTILTDVEQVCATREYHIFRGFHKGVEVCVASHGVGSSGANVLFEEVIAVGVKVIIRAGTCGAYKPDTPRGSHFILTAAVREDGASNDLVPASYPAMAHFEVIQKLIETANEHGNSNPGYSYTVGIGQSVANFYAGPKKRKSEMWLAANVLGQDMEASSLFVVANLRNVKAGAIMTMDGCIFNNDEAGYDPYAVPIKLGVETMITISFDALIKISPTIAANFVLFEPATKKLLV